MTASGALGFVIGSCVGFVGGAVHYYQTSLAQAYLALDMHPRLMRLHLIDNFLPRAFSG